MHLTQEVCVVAIDSHKKNLHKLLRPVQRHSQNEEKQPTSFISVHVMEKDALSMLWAKSDFAQDCSLKVGGSQHPHSPIEFTTG